MAVIVVVVVVGIDHGKHVIGLSWEEGKEVADRREEKFLQSLKPFSSSFWSV